jgi:hypothetical protein
VPRESTILGLEDLVDWLLQVTVAGHVQRSRRAAIVQRQIGVEVRAAAAVREGEVRVACAIGVDPNLAFAGVAIAGHHDVREHPRDIGGTVRRAGRAARDNTREQERNPTEHGAHSTRRRSTLDARLR